VLLIDREPFDGNLNGGKSNNKIKRKIILKCSCGRE